MPSVTDLCNDSLATIGEGPITAIDDGTIKANHCDRIFETLRDAVLRDHIWNFALKRIELAQTTTPVFDWDYAFTLPADCLRVIRMGDNDDTPWKIEGRRLVTNTSTAKILYIAIITDMNVWDTMAFQGLATWMASKLATAIKRDIKLAAGLRELYKDILRDAKAIDGQEGIPDVVTATDLIDGRDE